jgi:hypothetical protein
VSQILDQLLGFARSWWAAKAGSMTTERVKHNAENPQRVCGRTSLTGYPHFSLDLNPAKAQAAKS